MQTDNSGMYLAICIITFYISIPKSHFVPLDGHKHEELTRIQTSAPLGNFLEGKSKMAS